MSADPKITVFIPAYNRERYIGASISSVLAQSFASFEVLVVDDGSIDSTRDVVRSFSDERVRLICNETNLGIPRTRNKGLEHARGEFIALLDSDDVMHPHRLAIQLAFLEQHRDYAEIGTWGRAIAEDGRKLWKFRLQPLASEAVQAHLLFRCCISNRSVMGRTALMREYGYNPEFERCQDYDLHVRLARRHRVGNLPRVLVYGRQHGAQITRQTHDLGDLLKRRIAASQLEELGLKYSEEDLERHVRLSRARKTGTQPDSEFLRWAEDWLRQISAANRHRACYDQHALEEAVSEVWLKICLAAVGGIGRQALGRFVRSPLRAGCTVSMRQTLVAGVLRQRVQ